MLRLNFLVGLGDSPTLMLASFVRFCADGSLRGPDNYIVARCVDGLWHVGGRAHRELECDGPVRIRVVFVVGEVPVYRGPFQHLRTVNGRLYGDTVNLGVRMPGRVDPESVACHEITFLS